MSVVAGSAAVSFAQTYWPAIKGSTEEAQSDAELLVHLMTEAEKQGQGMLLAEVYEASQLKKVSHAH
jgi:hypothetical protein